MHFLIGQELRLPSFFFYTALRSFMFCMIVPDML